MATPIYKGTTQPSANSGWLSGLGSWFGGSPPVYAGNGQASQAGSGYLGGSAPAYKQVTGQADGGSSNAASADAECQEPERITVLIPRELIDAQQ